MNKVIRLIGIIMCLVFGENSEGTIPLENSTLPAETKLSKLVENHKDKLSKSKVYIAVSVYDQVPFIPNLRKTLEANVTELARYGVKSHVIITCDGRDEDFNECNKQFKGFPEKLQILFKEKDNEKILDIADALMKNDIIEKPEKYASLTAKQEKLLHHLGAAISVSLVRYHQLKDIHELMKKDEEENLSPYFFMFDGDDIIHKDLLLIELLALLETGADTASPGNYFGMYDKSLKENVSSGNILRCKVEDSQEILKRASREVDSILMLNDQGYFEEFAFNLFDRRVLEKTLSKNYVFGYVGEERPINPNTDFVTLDPFKDAITKLVKVFLLNVPGQEKYQKAGKGSDPFSVPFFDKRNEQNTLFYYMQHNDSMQGQIREMKWKEASDEEILTSPKE